MCIQIFLQKLFVCANQLLQRNIIGFTKIFLPKQSCTSITFPFISFSSHYFCSVGKIFPVRWTHIPIDFGHQDIVHILSKVFFNARNLKMHVKLHQEEKPFPCKECENFFTEAFRLRNHQKLHQSEKPFTCDQCDKRFRSPSKLKSHIMFHTREKPFSCNLCKKQFAQKSAIKSHMRTHTGETPFKCEECGKAFKRSDKLRQHQRNHTGEILHHTGENLPLHCSLCNKFFKRPEYFKRHQLIHTGQKPFPCNECEKSFRQVSNLKRHKLMHSGKKPFSCKECGKSFKQPEHLKCHLTKHSGERAFKCEKCEKSFARKDNLRKHNITHIKENSTGSKKTFQKGDKFKASNTSTNESQDLKCDTSIRTNYEQYPLVKCEKYLSKENNEIMQKTACSKQLMLEEIFSYGSSHAADEKGDTKFNSIEVNFLCNFCDSSFLEKDTLNWHQIFCHMIKLWFSFIKMDCFWIFFWMCFPIAISVWGF